ncbi:flagellar basal body rod protein FlgB [Carboxydothermus ferrireducens]|uniref:Flagellar basal body rod protein FlgB n=1 Tax=Carboxydothermus ferrireducens DSM 11255 TaxID=1119529 RepID=A0ABX2R9Z7_9THEO|nr:flagellar basal body rod protein FlgB [Carboxydothermus ferrireducens]NYE56893.1 flagellar basal-body rod protein FlgB [Carboxydothermus ferrireducens DSM 11255]
MDLFGGVTYNLLKLGIDAATIRQQAIAHNIANVNTPGYRKEVVVFEEKVQEFLNQKKGNFSLKTTHPRHLTAKGFSLPFAEVKRETSTAMRIDKNNVDIETEMVDLAYNQLYYETAVERLKGTLASLEMVITGGRR